MSELYASGKTGDFMQYSRNPYHTVSHMKLQVHTKILAGDYPYYACLATAVTRVRFTTDLLNAIGT